jgi:hypothetical protein
MSAECVFIIHVRRKPEMTLEVKCSLTGGICYCESFPLMCTRRTWGLAYEKRHGAPIKVEGR